MTTDQMDTRDYLEQLARYFDYNAKAVLVSDPAAGGLVTFKMNLSSTVYTTRSQYIQIHPNGKPAWDGERSKET